MSLNLGWPGYLAVPVGAISFPDCVNGRYLSTMFHDN